VWDGRTVEWLLVDSIRLSFAAAKQSNSYPETIQIWSRPGKSIGPSIIGTPTDERQWRIITKMRADNQSNKNKKDADQPKKLDSRYESYISP
jgi:hypothetical protein